MFLGIIYSIAGCVVGSGAVAGADRAVNGKIISLSAKARMIQSVGAPVVTGTRIPPVVEDKMLRTRCGGGDEHESEVDLCTDRWLSMLDICR